MKSVLSRFPIKGEILSCEPYGNGHINQTFLVVTSEEQYILQRINNYVFPDVDMLMNNIDTVTSYLRNVNVETLEIVKTINHKLYATIGNEFYRLYIFVKNSLTLEKVSDYKLAYIAAKAFGQFHKTLNKLDASKIGEIIPNFHNTKKRYENFLSAVEKDVKDRKKNCLKEIEIVKKYEKEFSYIVDALENKQIPYYVTHNDPKINNVLFDKYTKEIRCVIDLDTIMPGSVLYDVGDALRSLFTGENEDSEDLSLLKVDFELFENYISGYLSEMKGYLNENEVNLIKYAPFILTIECGMRFLEDYLKGDVYFHIKKDNHNLIRARTQLTLAENIFNNKEKLDSIVQRIIKE